MKKLHTDYKMFVENMAGIENAESEYEEFDILYFHEMTNDTTGESMGIVEYNPESDSERPFMVLIWDNDENDYVHHSGELTLQDAKEIVNNQIELLYGFDEDESEN